MSILGTKSPDGGFSLPPAEIERRSGVRLAGLERALDRLEDAIESKAADPCVEPEPER